RQRKMRIELAVEDFLRRLHDRLGAPRIKKPERAIGLRRSALDQRQSRDQRARHELFADGEIMPRAFGLRAPIGFGGHVDRAEGIGLAAEAEVRRLMMDDRWNRISSVLCLPSSAACFHFLRNRSSRTTSPPPVSGGGASVSSAGNAAGFWPAAL